MRQGTHGIAQRAGIGLLLVGTLVLGGCEYWPPALQAQIEQLRIDLQAATTERAKLESQLADATRMKDELQARAEDLSRSNREMSARVASLEQTVKTLQEKMAKSPTAKKSTVAPKRAAKPVAKPAPKKKAGRAA
jgi:chromosome segregation ATPase